MAAALGDLARVEAILNDDPDTVRTTVSERYFPRQNPRSGGSIYIYGFGFTRTPHTLAQEFGHTEVFELLMQRSPGWLRLVQAAELGDETLFQEILRKQPTLFARLTASAARRIIGTAVRNHDGAVKRLLEAGWPADAMMENRQTALHYAAWHGNLRMVEALLQHAAPLEVVETEHGGTPLGWAWYRDSGDYAGVARALVKAGARLPGPVDELNASEEVLEAIR